MYTFYPDVYFASQWITSVFALSILHRIYRPPISKKRVFLAGTVMGLLSTVFVMIIHPFRLYCVLMHVVVIPLGIGWCSRPFVVKEFFIKIAISYGAIWTLYGCVEWIELHTKRKGNGLLLLCTLLVYAVVAAFVKVKEQSRKKIPVLLRHKGCELSLIGYCDTGNLLIDPYTNRPVHVLSKRVIEPFLEATGEKSIRLIPYETISGKELMESVTLEEMILCKKQPVLLKRVVVGMVEHQILKGDSGQLLLNVSQLNL